MVQSFAPVFNMPEPQVARFVAPMCVYKKWQTGMHAAKSGPQRLPTHKTARLWWRDKAFCTAPLFDDSQPGASLFSERLHKLGINGLWLSSPVEDERSKNLSPIRDLALQAQRVGLSVVTEIPLPDLVSDEPTQEFRQAVPECASSALTHLETLKVVTLDCNSGPVPRALSLHAGLAHFLKAQDGVWPFWACTSLDSRAETGSATMNKLRHLLVAIQIVLRGCPLFCWQDVVQWDPATCDSIARLIRWRSSQPAFLIGKMRLLPMHDNLLMFYREYGSAPILCAFNLSDRYVRYPLLVKTSRPCLISGSGLEGGRIIQGHIDCDPWGALFAFLHP